MLIIDFKRQSLEPLKTKLNASVYSYLSDPVKLSILKTPLEIALIFATYSKLC